MYGVSKITTRAETFSLGVVSTHYVMPASFCETVWRLFKERQTSRGLSLEPTFPKSNTEEEPPEQKGLVIVC